MIIEADDPILDPTFRPCRDERCGILVLHREHKPSTRSRQLRKCPVCGSKIVRLPRKHASCSKCSWRVTNTQPDTEEE